MPIPPFELALQVRPEDIDDLGHVNNVVYLGWVQDAAIAHWTSESSDEERTELAWVAVRHEIDYKQAAMPGDAIIARTWVGPAEAVRFERRTQILRATDRAILAVARTQWCPIVRQTGRVTRVSASIRERFSDADAPAP